MAGPDARTRGERAVAIDPAAAPAPTPSARSRDAAMCASIAAAARAGSREAIAPITPRCTRITGATRSASRRVSLWRISLILSWLTRQALETMPLPSASTIVACIPSSTACARAISAGVTPFAAAASTASCSSFSRRNASSGAWSANCAAASRSIITRKPNASRISRTSTCATCMPRCGTVRMSPSASRRGMSSRIAPSGIPVISVSSRCETNWPARISRSRRPRVKRW